MANTADANDMADRIELRLKQLGISARSAGIKSGGGGEMIRKVLRAARRNKGYNPRRDTMELIAVALETSVEWLFYGETPPGGRSAPLTRGADAQLEAAPQLSVRDRAILAGMDVVFQRLGLPPEASRRIGAAILIASDERLPTYPGLTHEESVREIIAIRLQPLLPR